MIGIGSRFLHFTHVKKTQNHPTSQRYNVSSTAEIGRRCTDKDWIGHIHFGSNKTRFEYCLNSRKELVYSRGIQVHTGGITIRLEIMKNTLIPYNWKDFIFHRSSAFNQFSITQTGLVAGKASEGRLLIHSEVMRTKKKNQVKTVQHPRKVHFRSHWRRGQNAVYWTILSRAQDHVLEFWQTKSTAIIVYQSVPNHCIERVVSENGGRILFQRVLTPGLGQEQHSEARGTFRSSSINSSSSTHDHRRVAPALGNRFEQVIKMNSRIREMFWLPSPQAPGKRCGQTKKSGNLLKKKLIFVLTVFLKKKFTVTNRIWTTSASKWQNFRMNQKPRACTKTCKRVIVKWRNEPQNSTNGELRNSRSKTKNGYNALPCLFGRWISVLQVRCLFEAASSDHFRNSKEIYGVAWQFLLFFFLKELAQEADTNSTNLTMPKVKTFKEMYSNPFWNVFKRTVGEEKAK